MYAIVQVGAYQYKVEAGDTIEVNRLETEKDKDVTLDKVLLFANDQDVRIGRPYLKDVKVQAKVVAQTMAEKKIAFRYRARKNFANKKGHRQKLTALSITKIEG